ncbi:hypothetical protein MNBD_GAMMA07-1705 [hydrothermal vent metagenome]|uniref:Uncharacterized protein n=1 Tax=hydrothermal vent metagenome TaxID=652676 RepID=A0A3B0WLB5_9ZZZZ
MILRKFRKPLIKHQGAALVTALVFMGILTMLGVSSMRDSTVDLKIHNSMNNRLNAFQCAEAALRQGERFILRSPEQLDDTQTGIPDPATFSVWVSDTDELDNMVNELDAWWILNGVLDAALTNANVQIGCAVPARYLVQSMGGAGNSSDDLSFKAEAKSQVNGYRISSRSEGVSSSAAIILQSTFTRQFN